MEELHRICGIFGIKGKHISTEIIKTGNINQTCKVTYDDEGRLREYIVQNINKYVFKNPGHIMANIDAVTRHIAGKYDGDSSRYVLDFLKTADGLNYYIDENDRFFRAYRFIPDSVTYNTFDDLSVLRKAGEAFGRFQMQLSDFDASVLYEIIPDFHNTQARYRVLEEKIKADCAGRASSVAEDIDYLMSIRSTAEALGEMLRRGELPLRVTHNDTKCNNVLFDENTDEPLAVIDLDTVMPGLTAYDFGDAVRFAANTAEEDEADLSKVSLDLSKYRAFAQGFIPQTAQFVTASELDSMYLGPVVMAAELAVRFLSDYLDGDRYFKCSYDGHNLVRARCQTALVKDMILKADETKKLIAECVKQ